ncbi:MAG: ABC transporter permease [Rubrobacteridae bacterium]|nr:ABC transporter permease [Rubrobacteridae bacterium]
MNLFESFRLAIDAILANKMRSMLTTLGIVIGVSAVILLVSVGQGLKSSITESFSDFGSNLLYVMPGEIDFSSGQQPVFTNKLKVEHANDVKRGAVYVKRISAGLEQRGTVKYGNNSRKSPVTGITGDFLPMQNFEIERGANITESQVTAGKRVAVLGKTAVDKVFDGANPIGRRINIEGQKFTVIGVFKSKGKAMGQDMDDIAYIPITAAQRIFGVDWVSYFVVEARDEGSIDLASVETKRILGKRLKSGDYSVMSQEQTLDTLNQVLGTLTFQ